MNDMAKILAYLHDPNSVFKQRLELGFYLTGNEFLHLTPEEKLETRDKTVLDFFKRLEDFYRNLLLVSYLYQMFPSERRTMPKEPMQETILRESPDVYMTIGTDGTSYDIREVVTRLWEYPPDIQEKVRKMKFDSHLESTPASTTPVVAEQNVIRPKILPNIYFFLEKAVNNSLELLKERKSHSEICRNCSQHILVNEYKTVQITDKGLPEVVKFCSSLCMDEGHN